MPKASNIPFNFFGETYPKQIGASGAILSSFFGNRGVGGGGGHYKGLTRPWMPGFHASALPRRSRPSSYCHFTHSLEHCLKRSTDRHRHVPAAVQWADDGGRLCGWRPPSGHSPMATGPQPASLLPLLLNTSPHTPRHGFAYCPRLIITTIVPHPRASRMISSMYRTPAARLHCTGLHTTATSLLYGFWFPKGMVRDGVGATAAAGIGVGSQVRVSCKLHGHIYMDAQTADKWLGAEIDQTRGILV